MIIHSNSRVFIALAMAASCGSNRMLLFHNVTHVTVTYLHAEVTCCSACEKIARVCGIVRRDERLVKLKKIHPDESANLNFSNKSVDLKIYNPTCFLFSVDAIRMGEGDALSHLEFK